MADTVPVVASEAVENGAGETNTVEELKAKVKAAETVEINGNGTHTNGKDHGDKKCSPTKVPVGEYPSVEDGSEKDDEDDEEIVEEDLDEDDEECDDDEEDDEEYGEKRPAPGEESCSKEGTGDSASGPGEPAKKQQHTE